MHLMKALRKFIGGKQKNAVPVNVDLPPQMGLRQEIPLLGMVERLESSLANHYSDYLKQRVMSKHPELLEHEFEWEFLELKRYFIMTTILKEVPMFSTYIDDIWHEMILHTRAYQAFTEDFTGRFLHHSPHIKAKPMPHGRAWFDWVYYQLFEPTPYTYLIWKPFFRNPLDKDMLIRFETSSEDERSQTDFTVSARYKEETEQVISLLIKKVKEQIAQARYSSAESKDLAQAAVFYSMKN